MKTWLVSTIILTIILSFWVISSEGFEIKYPGERGFYIGKPITYIIAGDSNIQNIGKEGTFTFGQSRTTINGVEFYDCVYHSPSGDSHFFLRLDSTDETLVQKGFKVGLTELTLDPAIKAIDYPISPGSSWSETTNLTAKNIEIPGLGKLTIPISAKGVKVETKVSTSTITVPSGNFETLLVESTYSGSLLGIPITLIQRTWLNVENINIKRNFEFTQPTKVMIYDIELSQSTASPVSPSERMATVWSNIKSR